ncbi:MAG: hypothetical protein SFZ03_06215 [Candidatus Melainabacteria bacterium]|nr:hypothetical protein [Candidatus Melainabacteria bacterium]
MRGTSTSTLPQAATITQARSNAQTAPKQHSPASQRPTEAQSSLASPASTLSLLEIPPFLNQPSAQIVPFGLSTASGRSHRHATPTNADPRLEELALPQAPLNQAKQSLRYVASLAATGILLSGLLLLGTGSLLGGESNNLKPELKHGSTPMTTGPMQRSKNAQQLFRWSPVKGQSIREAVGEQPADGFATLAQDTSTSNTPMTTDKTDSAAVLAVTAEKPPADYGFRDDPLRPELHSYNDPMVERERDVLDSVRFTGQIHGDRTTPRVAILQVEDPAVGSTTQVKKVGESFYVEGKKIVITGIYGQTLHLKVEGSPRTLPLEPLMEDEPTSNTSSAPEDASSGGSGSASGAPAGGKNAATSRNRSGEKQILSELAE